MPFLQPNITYAGDATPLFVPLGGNITIPGDITATGSITSDVAVAAPTVGAGAGGLSSTGGATIIGATGLVVQGPTAQDGVARVLESDGNGLEIRAQAGTGVTNISGVTVNTPGPIAISITGPGVVTLPLGANAPLFNLKGGSGLGGPNYGIQNISAAGNQSIPNTAITANSIVNVTLQSASGIVFVPRVSLNPGVGFTIYNDDPIVPHTMSYNVVCLDASI